MTKPKLINVIYDGQCAFCIRSLEMFRAADVRRLMRFYDSHHSQTAERFPILKDADLDQAMFVVVDGESPQRGFFAFRRMLWSSPILWLLIPLFYFPGIAYIGTRVYTWVARHRSSFGCRTSMCSLQEPPTNGFRNEGTLS
jgi:predicted DCC family thiol-disulfide oxidoreductase YuxK